MTDKLFLCCVLVGVMGQAACGGGASHTQNDGTGAGSAATTGSRAQAGTSAATGTAGVPAIDLNMLMNLVNMATTPMCDSSAQSVSECGGNSCPELADDARMTCTINCCTSDSRCGTRIADTRVQQLLGTMCTATAVADPRCPSTTALGMTLAGCCEQNMCGQILGTLCLPALGNARACNAAPTSDAGL